jgi:hypothetical protein
MSIPACRPVADKVERCPVQVSRARRSRPPFPICLGFQFNPLNGFVPIVNGLFVPGRAIIGELSLQYSGEESCLD